MLPMLTPLFSLAARLIVSVMVWLALFPIAALLATPFIFVLALWDDAAYVPVVRDRYARFWSRWLDGLPTFSVDWS